MNATQKREIIEILQAHIGDDLYRAKCAFRGTDLSQQWGQSGKTKQQVLNEYQAHEDRIKGLIESVKQVPV